jgi:hypothetical protein
VSAPAPAAVRNAFASLAVDDGDEE